jgi:hypothetical protein
VVAFAFAPGEDQLLPVTAERGLVEDYALKTPTGEVHVYGEIFFSEENWLASRRARAA